MSPRTIVRRQLIKSSLELISVIIGILPVTINSVFLCYGSTLLLEPVSVGSAVLNKLLKFKYLSRKENRDTKYPFILVLILEYLWINLVQNWKNEITNPQLIIFAYHYDFNSPLLHHPPIHWGSHHEIHIQLCHWRSRPTDHQHWRHCGYRRCLQRRQLAVSEDEFEDIFQQPNLLQDEPHEDHLDQQSRVSDHPSSLGMSPQTWLFLQ